MSILHNTDNIALDIYEEDAVTLYMLQWHWIIYITVHHSWIVYTRHQIETMNNHNDTNNGEKTKMTKQKNEQTRTQTRTQTKHRYIYIGKTDDMLSV